MPFLLFFWAAGSSLLFVLLLSPRVAFPQRMPVVAVALTSAVMLVVPIIFYPEPRGVSAIDILNFQAAGQRVLDGQDVYPSPFGLFTHPYLPFQMYVFAASEFIADATGLPFFVVMRIPQAAASVGVAVLVVLAVRRLSPAANATRAGLLYAVCPLPMLVTVYHGQFDVISVFFALLAVYLLLAAATRHEHDWSAIALGLAILQKLWPVLLAPLLVAHVATMRGRVRFGGITASVVLSSVVVYMIAFDSSFELIVDQVLRYESPLPRAGGIILVADRLPEFVPGRDAFVDWWIDNGLIVTALALAAATGVCIARGTDLVRSVVAVLCVLFVFVPEGAFYHYLWIVPFGLIAGDRGFAAVVALATTGRYLALGFLGGGLFLPPPDSEAARWGTEHEWILGVITWLAFACWAAVILWGGRRQQMPYAADWSSSAEEAVAGPAAGP